MNVYVVILEELLIEASIGPGLEKLLFGQCLLVTF